jgi:predicted transcriptional regulator
MESKLPELLQKLGYSRTISAVLGVMLDSNAKFPMGAYEIELAAHLRQPEASTALTALVSWGWLKEKKEKPKGDIGRPKHLYSLGITKEKLVDAIREVIHAKNDEKMKMVEELEKELKVN